MAPLNKLLIDHNGQPLIRAAVENVLAANVQDVIVVTGHMQHEVQQALEGLPVRLVHNPDYRQGMGGSLACGIRAVTKTAAGALICLGDMPHIKAATIDGVVEALDLKTRREICIPAYQGRRGHPVLFSRRFFPLLEKLSQDAGAKMIIEAHADSIVEIEVADPGILIDIDSTR